MPMQTLPAKKPKGPRTRVVSAALLIVAIMLLAIVPTGVMAIGGPSGDQGAGGSAGGNGYGGPDRDVEVDMEPHRARIRSTVQDGDGDLDYDIQAANRLSIQMQYMAQGDGQQADVQMTLAFKQMLEYEDANGNGELDPTDEVLSTYDLENATFDDLVHTDATASDGRMMHTITARTSDGVFAMVSRTTETRTQTQSGDLSPNLMKIDIEVQDYQWTRTTSRLALRLTVETQGPVTHVTDPAQREYMEEGEAGLEVADGEQTGFTTWVRTCQVDGASKQVRAQLYEDAEGTSLYFNYEQGDAIVHDPKLGVTIPALELFDLMDRLLPYLAAMGAGAAVIGAAVLWRKRTA